MNETEHSIHIARLIAGQVSGRITGAEAAEIRQWAAISDANRQAYEAMLAQEAQKSHFDRLRRKDVAAAFERVRARYRNQRKSRQLLKWLPYAAAVLLVASVVGYFAVDSRKSSVDSLAATEIQPGGNRATLTLADGRTIDLSSEQAGIVVADGITYLDGSQVMENEELRMKNEGPLNLNSITTPKGGTYQVTLPDGSKVWLNANSTLKYPSRFPGESREVILEGEAYFDITELQGTRDTRAPANNVKSLAGARVSRVPFLVKTDNQTVEVLGTEFNISAYAEDSETKTTLVEGKVKVSNLKSHTSNLISPGEQSIVRGAATTVQEVDTQPYIAWREGLIVLDHADLPTIIRQIERWYDVEVELPEITDSKRVFGEIPRNVNLSVILDALTDYYGITFKLEGRKVIGSN